MIKSIVNRYRRLVLLQLSIEAALIALLSWLFFNALELELPLSLGLSLAILAAKIVFFFKSTRWKKNSTGNFLENLNRNFPQYQESAHLLESSVSEGKLGPLEVIQKERVVRVFSQHEQQGLFNTITPKFYWLRLLFLSAICIALHLIGQPAFNWVKQQLNDPTAQPDNQVPMPAKVTPPPSLSKSSVNITPLAYTEMSSRTEKNLNIEVTEGATLEWLLAYDKPRLQYWLKFSDDEPIKLEKARNSFTTKVAINRTRLYRLGYQKSDEIIYFPEIYTIKMVRDRSPKIRIISPRNNVVEFSNSVNPEFELVSEISDDYAISEVAIIASVAKGSGESVKFRDKRFDFDSSKAARNSLPIAVQKNREVDKFNKIVTTYRKKWNLKELGMEPGDEVYFSIIATDNRYPTPQKESSSSIIVRWLEDDDSDILSTGIRINFVPEYFRSQRQIIIETEQLIADESDMSTVQFEETSIDLGHSQSDLKQKFGQYLGDEFGEGPGEQFGMADGYHGGESIAGGEAAAGLEQEHHDGQHQEQESKQDNTNKLSHEHEHHDDHESENSDSTADSLSGKQAIIDEFGHNHGSVEIGPLSQKDPKSWMKMAVNQMWQAELHLMLSEPKLALPFEYKAYDYLKRARQAERIYAKRLGFKPPPVSEDRRLSGELKDIRSYDFKAPKYKQDESNDQLFQDNFQLLVALQQRATKKDNSSWLLNEERERLSQLSSQFLSLSESRPALLKYASIAERIALSDSYSSLNCESCSVQLRRKLWQLISPPESPPEITGFDDDLPHQVRTQLIKQLDIREVNQ